MKTTEMKVEIVADLMKAEQEGPVNKTEFAKSKGISTTSLDRYQKQFEHDAAELLSAHPKQEEEPVAAESTVKEDEKPVTKKAIATEIVKRMEGEKRKDVIAALVSEAELTKAGAGTYYYNIKKELGL